jgi:hypothetical protein
VRAARAVAAAAVAASVLLALAPAAHAGAGDDTGGNSDDNRYSAWGYYGQATGGGSVSSPTPCDIPDEPGVQAFLQWNVVMADTNTYIVFTDCVAAGVDADQSRRTGGTPGMENLDEDWVIAGEPEELVQYAISQLDPQPPAIATDPTGGVAGMVGFPVYFSFPAGELREQSGPVASDGPLTVVVHAKPDPATPVVWHTGDDRTACEDGSTPAVCVHSYRRSSVGQPGRVGSEPAYVVSADVTYTGWYEVEVNGAVVARGADIGDLVRTTQASFAVTEAQALSTRG